MTDAGAVKIRVDLKANILFITLNGAIKDQQLARAYTDARFAAADLRPGFALIADFSAANLAHLSSVSTFKKIMNYLQSRGIGQVIRISDEDSLILKQIPRISAGLTTHAPIHVKSMEEAREIVANTQKAAEAPRP
jgi:hypothetical protein